MRITIHSVEELSDAAKQLLTEFANSRLFLFNGEMGSGKTTFIKAICNELKVKDTLSSPTYSIVNEYQTSSNELIYHFDLYRIKSKSELYDIGFYEYLASGNYCFIEWPEIGEKFYENVVIVDIELSENNRIIKAIAK